MSYMHKAHLKALYSWNYWRSHASKAFTFRTRREHCVR